MTGATDIGAIIAYLRMDRSDYQAGVRESEREADRLDGRKIRVTVETNRAAAISDIRAVSDAANAAGLRDLQASNQLRAAHRAIASSTASVTAATERLAAARDRVNRSGVGTAQDYQRIAAAERSLAGALRTHEGATDRLTLAQLRLNAAQDAGATAGGGSGSGSSVALPNLKVAAILAALPLVGPVAGAATSALGSFAGAAGVAGLAVKGFNNEIAAGTGLGQQVSHQVDGLTGSLTKLESVAAHGASGGVLSGLQQVNAFMPTLTPLVAVLSHDLGQAFSVGTGGLLSALRTAEPLLLDAGKYTEQLAEGLARAGSSPQFAAFIAYSRRELPVVLHTIENLGAAGVHLAAALAPLGTVVLGALNGISVVLKEIPVSVLTTLAAGAVAAYIGFKALAIVETVNRSLLAYSKAALIAEGASKRLAAQNATAAGGLKAFASSTGAVVGGAALAGLAILALTRAVENYIDRNNSEEKALKGATVAQQSFTTALMQSRGAIDSNVTGALALQLSNDGITKKAAAAGISQEQLIAGITSSKGSYVDAAGQIQNYAGSLNDVIDQWKAGGKPSHDTIKAIQEIATEYQRSRAETELYLAQQVKFANTQPIVYGALAANTVSLQTLGTQYHLTADQVQAYAAVLGVTADQIAAGTVTNGQLAAAVHKVAAAYNSATATGTAYLASLSAFSQSQGTAADRAALIGSTLVAANGDALTFAATMVQAATANQAFVTAFDDARTAAAKAGVAFSNAKAGVVDLGKGTINYHNAAAGPLIQDLQAMQDAAMKAAGATYQHEVATHGASLAAQHAVDIYQAQTSGALAAEYKQLGLTSQQAQALADTYFKLPKDITTQIKAIGTDPVLTVLNRIGALLAHLTGQPWVSTIGVDTVSARTHLAQIQMLLDQTVRHRTVTVQADVSAAIRSLTSFISAPASKVVQVVTQGLPSGPTGGRQVVEGRATGGEISGPGTGTSDSVAAVNQSTGRPVRLSTGEFIETAASTNRNRAALDAANHGARLAVISQALAEGGFVGVTAPAPKASSSTTSKAAKAAKAAKEVQATLVVTAGGGAAYGIANYIKGQIPSVKQATALLAAAVNDAFQITKVRADLAAVKTDLDNLRQAKAAFSGGVTSGLNGQLDLTKFGDIGMMTDAVASNRAAAAKFTGEVQQLGRDKLPPGLIEELTKNSASAGLDTVSALAPNSPQLRQLVAQYQANQAATMRAGSVAGSILYDPRINADKARAAADTARIGRLESNMVKLVGALGKETKQTVEIKVGSEVLARVMIKSHAFAGVIDSLGRTLVTG
jgi:hypothetical protein